MNSADAAPALHLPPRYLRRVLDILRACLPHAEVWAYGSRVRGDHYQASDLDLAVRQPDDLNRPQSRLWQARDAFSESDLPIIVQLVDWASIPQAFRDEIAACHVTLQPPATDDLPNKDGG